MVIPTPTNPYPTLSTLRRPEAGKKLLRMAGKAKNTANGCNC